MSRDREQALREAGQNSSSERVELKEDPTAREIRKEGTL
jgi:hypothetical protein